MGTSPLQWRNYDRKFKKKSEEDFEKDEAKYQIDAFFRGLFFRNVYLKPISMP